MKFLQHKNAKLNQINKPAIMEHAKRGGLLRIGGPN